MTLLKREAHLRAEALGCIGRATTRLCGAAFAPDAMRAALYDQPLLALRRIRTAEAHLRQAKTALRAWGRK